MPDEPEDAPSAKPGTFLAAIVGFVAMAVVAGLMVTVAVAPAIALSGTAATKGIGLFQSLPSDLKIAALDQRTKIFAKSHGKNVQIASFYTQNRELVGWSDLPKALINATLAAEDVRFYEHGAIDPEGIVRAAAAIALHKRLQGASTISQQYVKNICIQAAERLATQKQVDAAYEACVDTSLRRKLLEMRLAIGLEKKYTKNQILLGYLNIAPFGGRVYGIEAAAEYYFGTTAKQLTASQAATLIAIVNEPEALRPDEKSNLAANATRRDYILASERKHGLISATDYAAAIKSPAKIHLTSPKTGCMAAGVAGFFCDYVVNELQTNSAFGKTAADRWTNLYSGGLNVYTTLNLDLQKNAQRVMNTYVPQKSSAMNIGGAAVSVEVGTGRIVSMVQNKVFDNTQNAAQRGAQYTSVNYNAGYNSTGKQPGSTFKVFTLLQWLETGHGLNAKVNTNQRTIPESKFTACGKTYGYGSWSVGNDEGVAENGFRTVLNTTALSINAGFATMAEQLDLCKITATAEALGVSSPLSAHLEANPSAVIGQASTVTPLGMATAYAGLANYGNACTPIAIDRVVKNGKAIAVPKSTCKQAVPRSVAVAADYALRGVFTGGTASNDQTADGLYEFGKTGTNDDNNGTWMIGTTSKVTTAVWVGSVSGSANMRAIYSFPYCPVMGSTQAAIERHCVWKGIQTAVNKVYGGATSWPYPQAQYLTSGTYGVGEGGSAPSVTGQTSAAAQATLQALGYTVSIGSSVQSSQAVGTVVSVDISGASATLHLSSGPAKSGGGKTPAPKG